MRREKDFEDFLKCLNKYKVKYCIVGALAVAYYSIPRYTDDLDIFIYPAPDNSKKAKMAMAKFGLDVSQLEDNYFATPGNFYQIGVAPVMIHLITSLEGVRREAVFQKRVKASYGQTKTYFIGLSELEKNKRVVNRPQDRMDLKALRQRREK